MTLSGKEVALGILGRLVPRSHGMSSSSSVPPPKRIYLGLLRGDPSTPPPTKIRSEAKEMGLSAHQPNGYRHEKHGFKVSAGTPLVVQWLRLPASNAGAPGFNPWSGS